jgi:hypothetical protein
MWEQSIITVRIFVLHSRVPLSIWSVELHVYTLSQGLVTFIHHQIHHLQIFSSVISSSVLPLVGQSLGMWRDVPSCLMKCVTICNTLKKTTFHDRCEWNGSGINYNLEGQFEKGDSFLLI